MNIFLHLLSLVLFHFILAYEYQLVVGPGLRFVQEIKIIFQVDWTFELLWDPLLTISPNLFFWKQLTVRSLQSK